MTIAFPYNSPVGAKARMDRSRFSDGYATGSIAFAAQPSANDTVTIAGTAMTFKATGAAGNQSNIGADVPSTLDALIAVLSASADANIKKCKYSRTAGAKAAGNVTFGAQPSANDTVTIGGIAVTFKTTGATGNQVNIGTTLPLSLAALAAVLNASDDDILSNFSYTSDATKLYITAKAGGAVYNVSLAASVATASGAALAGGTDLLIVTAAAPGTAGNALTLAASVATASGATLANGDTRRQKWKDREETNRYEPVDRTRWANREGANRWVYTPGSYYPS